MFERYCHRQHNGCAEYATFDVVAHTLWYSRYYLSSRSIVDVVILTDTFEKVKVNRLENREIGINSRDLSPLRLGEAHRKTTHREAFGSWLVAAANEIVHRPLHIIFGAFRHHDHLGVNVHFLRKHHLL